MSSISRNVERIRLALAEAQGDEAWGPDSETVKTDYSMGKAGVGGAKNVSDAIDVLDKYLFGIIDEILEEYDMTYDEAIDFVISNADAMAEDGMLPPLPEEDDLRGIAAWMGAAATVQFGQLVLAALDADTEEDEEE